MRERAGQGEAVGEQCPTREVWCALNNTVIMTNDQAFCVSKAGRNNFESFHHKEMLEELDKFNLIEVYVCVQK